MSKTMIVFLPHHEALFLPGELMVVIEETNNEFKHALSR
jgi:hypothetical protein